MTIEQSPIGPLHELCVNSLRFRGIRVGLDSPDFGFDRELELHGLYSSGSNLHGLHRSLMIRSSVSCISARGVQPGLCDYTEPQTHSDYVTHSWPHFHFAACTG